jgi:DNA-binding LacI/PurR family transcriptional regulator
MKKQNINDVARLSGVGKATVSRVFSNSPLVAEATRARVLEAAGKIGYRPNPIARALTTSKTGNITIVVPNIQSFVMAQIVRGAMRGAREKGYSMFVLDSGEDTTHSAPAADYITLLHEHASDGVIFCYESAREQMEQIARDRPLLFLESTPHKDSVDAIRTDNRAGMQLLVDHLYGLGHRRIAGVFGKEGEYARSRLDHFTEALAEQGLSAPVELLRFSNWAIEDGYREFVELMKLPEEQRPGAIICVSDFMAMGAIRAAADLGIAVPEEVSIAGTDDATTSAFLVPSLTTLSFDPYSLGRDAAHQLIGRIEQPESEARSITVPVSLKKRASTGVFRNR